MFIHPDFDPVAVSLGPLQVRWYGLMYMFGFLSGWQLGRWRARLSQTRPGAPGVWKQEEMDDLIAWLVVGLIVGARLGYMLFYDFAGWMRDPLQLLRVWEGGMSFHGGAIGVCAAFWLFAKKTGRSFLQVADFVVPLAPPGLAFGRLGNFINGELWGRPTDLPWAVVFPDPRAGGLPRHPSQLYEMALEGVALFAILWWYSSKPRPVGRTAGLFTLGYGSFRFLVEFAREPDAHIGYLAFGWLTMGMLLCLPMMAVGGWLFFRPASLEKAGKTGKTG